jgi:carbohydrate kinase (thermoresistant glucokinase family)
MVVVVMGVSGSGKTAVARLLAGTLGMPFYDGDDFHPAANVAKMAQGIALDDDDRRPWLTGLAAKIAQWEERGGAVLACSALKERYRTTLSSQSSSAVRFVFLQGSRELISRRMQKRSGHFMPISLLDSQLAELEPPTNAITVSIEDPPERIVEHIMSALQSKTHR